MNSKLLDLLRGGGYILYARHGEATVGEDRPDLSFQLCNTQRNLSDYGRQQAIYYGEVLRIYGIPISYPVVSSPFCRTIETAQLAFGLWNVQIDPFWLNINNLSVNLPLSEQNRILSEMKSKLEIIPPTGKNTVIIAHGFPSGIGLGEIPYMGTVIIKPLGRGNGYEVISRLSLEELSLSN